MGSSRKVDALNAPPQERLDWLRRRVCYAPDTGQFTLREDVVMRYGPHVSRVVKRAGESAVTQRGGGYLSVCGYGAHRVAWFLMTGEWPSMDIDHINRDKSDNRWENLRHVSRAENLRNRADAAPWSRKKAE